MFIALDKLANQKLKQAIIVVPERSIGASFHDEPLSRFGFWADWEVKPRWNLCDAPGSDSNGKVDAVKKFVESEDKALVCTHATFRFAMERFGAEAFDDRLIAVDELIVTSNIADVRTRNRTRMQTVVEITPAEYADFRLHSAIDCNSVFEKPLTELSGMVRRKEGSISPGSATRDFREVRAAVLASPVVPDELKEML